jgi:recombination protein RecA
MKRDPVIDKVLAKINKDFSVKEKPCDLAGVMSTGCTRLDAALHTTGLPIGGLPLGRVIEIFGDPGSGKTSFCLYWIALYYKQHPEEVRPAVILDLERTITDSFVQGFGLTEDQYILRRPDTVEEALTTVIDLAHTGAIAFTVFDSVGAAQNQRQLARDVGDADVGGISKIMHETLRELTKACSDNTVTSFFINHVTMNPGAGMYANPETTPGGRALMFYASTRLRVRPIKENPKNKGFGIGRVQPVKHKTGRPYLGKGCIEFDWDYARGIPMVSDLIETAKKLGVVRNSAGQTKIRDSVATEDWYVPDPNMERGADAFHAWVEASPANFKKLQDIVLAHDLSTLMMEGD